MKYRTLTALLAAVLVAHAQQADQIPAPSPDSPQIVFDVKVVSIKQRLQAQAGFNWITSAPLTSPDTNQPSDGKRPPVLDSAAHPPVFRHFRTNPSNPTAPSSQPSKGILTEAQAKLVLRGLEARPGTKILAAPRVSTLSGRTAAVSIDQVDTFLKTEVTGTVANDEHKTISVQARIWTEEGADAPVHAANLYPNQTLVLSAPMTHQESAPDLNTVTLFLITPALIDNTGDKISLPPLDSLAIPPQEPGFKNGFSIPSPGALPTLRFREASPAR